MQFWNLPDMLRGLSQAPFEPVYGAPLDALSFTGLGVCQVHAGEMTAESVSMSRVSNLTQCFSLRVFFQSRDVF